MSGVHGMRQNGARQMVHVPADVQHSSPCICGKRLFVALGTCLWCGHGVPVGEAKAKLPCRLRHLPRDLGAILREGRRPDPHLDNVVWLDRLRDRWKVPQVDRRFERTLAGDWPTEDAEEVSVRVCPGCGESFEGAHGNRRYCSWRCRRDANYGREKRRAA